MREPFGRNDYTASEGTKTVLGINFALHEFVLIDGEETVRAEVGFKTSGGIEGKSVRNALNAKHILSKWFRFEMLFVSVCVCICCHRCR